MTPEERRKLEKKVAVLLAKAQREFERALKEVQNTGLLKLPLVGFKRRASSATRTDLALTKRPPRRSIRVSAADGTIPFHMRVTSVSKTIAPDGEIIGTAARAAAAHQVYVERETALEEVGGQERATQEVNSVAGAAQGYIERDGAMTSSFGTVAETLSERIAFWGAVDAAERIPRRHTMMLEIDDEERLTEIAGALSPDAPRPLIDIMKSRAAICVDTTMMRRVHEYLRAHKLNDLVAFDEGRGGVVQRRLVLELPADMTPIDRYRIAQRFCSETFEARNIRFHCAIHAPTSKNDDRNHHLHIVFYDRPTERILHPETGASVWDFEVVETKKTASRHTRSTRPLQKPKDRSFSDVKWPKKIREAYCRIVNERRAEVGQPPIYHPMTYAEAGVDVEPVPVLTRREFLDLERGIDNPVALAKIFRRWERLAFLEVVPEGALLRRSEIDPARQDVKLPAKKTTNPEDLVALTLRKAPASIVMAKALVGDRSITKARRADLALERKAVRIALAEIESTNLLLFPDTVDDQTRRRILDDLQRRLLADVTKNDRVLVEHLVVLDDREAKMRADLAALRPWEKSLPSRSLGDLLGQVGLGGVFAALEARNSTAVIRKARRPTATAADLSNTAEPVAPAATPQIVEETSTGDIAKPTAVPEETIIAASEMTVPDSVSMKNIEEPPPIVSDAALEAAQRDEPNVEVVTSPPIIVTPVTPVVEIDAAEDARNADADYLRAELGRLFGRDFVVDTTSPKYQENLFEEFARKIGQFDALIYLNYVKRRRQLDEIERDKNISLYYKDKKEFGEWDFSGLPSGFMPRGLLRPGHFPKGTACHLDHPDHAIPAFQYGPPDYSWLGFQLPEPEDRDYVQMAIRRFEEEADYQWRESAAYRELARLDELEIADPKAYAAARIPMPFVAGETYEQTVERINSADRARMREQLEREYRDLCAFHESQLYEPESVRRDLRADKMRQEEADKLRRAREFEEACIAEARERIERQQREREEAQQAERAAREQAQRRHERVNVEPIGRPGARYVIEDVEEVIARGPEIRPPAPPRETPPKVSSPARIAEPIAAPQRAAPVVEPAVDRRVAPPIAPPTVQIPVPPAAAIPPTPPVPEKAPAPTEPLKSPSTSGGTPTMPPTRPPSERTKPPAPVDRAAEDRRAGILQNKRRGKSKGWER